MYNTPIDDKLNCPFLRLKFTDCSTEQSTFIQSCFRPTSVRTWFLWDYYGIYSPMFLPPWIVFLQIPLNEIVKLCILSNKNDVIQYKWPMTGQYKIYHWSITMYTGLLLVFCMMLFFIGHYTLFLKLYTTYKQTLIKE